MKMMQWNEMMCSSSEHFDILYVQNGATDAEISPVKVSTKIRVSGIKVNRRIFQIWICTVIGVRRREHCSPAEMASAGVGRRGVRREGGRLGRRGCRGGRRGGGVLGRREEARAAAWWPAAAAVAARGGGAHRCRGRRRRSRRGGAGAARARGGPIWASRAAAAARWRVPRGGTRVDRASGGRRDFRPAVGGHVRPRGDLFF